MKTLTAQASPAPMSVGMTPGTALPRADVVAFPVNIRARPGYNFAKHDDTVSYRHGICDRVAQGRPDVNIVDDTKAEVATLDGYQASCLVARAVNKPRPALGWQLHKLGSTLPAADAHHRLTTKDTDMRYRLLTMPAVAIGAIGPLLAAPAAHGDNKRLNDAVVANVYTVQHHAGCTNDVRINPQLQLAAEWHARDVLNNRALDGDIGSDGSTPQNRAEAAGFRGTASETVAINPAMAISGIELMNQWYQNPADFAVMSNCANAQMGVWSENSPDRTVVVAVYGQPEHPVDTTGQHVPIDPTPDYDASDEIEFGNNWFAWILRGVYPPPAYPPS